MGKFCSNCGSQLQEGVRFCTNCGQKLASTATAAAQEAPAAKKKDYKIYKQSVHRINVWEICLHVVSLVLILAMVFVPIYVCEYEPTWDDLDELDEDEWEDVLDEGYLKKNFSLAEDLGVIIKGMTSSESEDGVPVALIMLMVGLFAIFELIMAIVLTISISRQLYASLVNLRQNDTATMLKYNEISKMGAQQIKPRVFKKQTVLTLVLYAFFDIIFAKIDSFAFGFLEMQRYMATFTGFSGFSVIFFILLAALIVFTVLKSKEEKALTLQIVKNELETE